MWFSFTSFYPGAPLSDRRHWSYHQSATLHHSIHLRLLYNRCNTDNQLFCSMIQLSFCSFFFFGCRNDGWWEEQSLKSWRNALFLLRQVPKGKRSTKIRFCFSLKQGDWWKGKESWFRLIYIKGTQNFG